MMSMSMLRAGALAQLIVICMVSGCSPTEYDGEVVGHIVEVTARSLTEVETLKIVAGDGREWEFAGGAFPGFTPSHLEEHQALGEPVKVVYVREDSGSLRIVRIEDG